MLFRNALRSARFRASAAALGGWGWSLGFSRISLSGTSTATFMAQLSALLRGKVQSEPQVERRVPGTRPVFAIPAAVT